jgi:hypothetical protein
MGGLTALSHQESQTRVLGMKNHPVPVFSKLPETKQGFRNSNCNDISFQEVLNIQKQ